MPSDEEPRNQAAEERLRRLLGLLQQARDLHQRIEHEIVWLANDLGMSLDQIGEAHDPPISRQRVAKRYDKPKPRRSRRDDEQRDQP